MTKTDDEIKKAKIFSRAEALSEIITEALENEDDIKLNENLKKFLDGEDISNGRIEAFSFLIIEDYGKNDFRLKSSRRNTGFDENFKTAKFAHDSKGNSAILADLDQKLGIENPHLSFRELFVYSRIRTHEYIHTGSRNSETNGHVGALFNDNNSNGTESARTSGSNHFHKERQQAIKKVIDEGAKDIEKIIKQINSLEKKLKLTKKMKRTSFK
ncbi:MAG: hypothetical protein SFV53_01185 [Rickettsiales bacterium]|nr:hypothetical protein [Rickettsiales bacterium]